MREWHVIKPQGFDLAQYPHLPAPCVTTTAARQGGTPHLPLHSTRQDALHEATRLARTFSRSVQSMVTLFRTVSNQLAGGWPCFQETFQVSCERVAAVIGVEANLRPP